MSKLDAVREEVALSFPVKYETAFRHARGKEVRE
jgi:hypothetical protein